MTDKDTPYSQLTPPIQIAQALGVTLSYEDAFKIHNFITAQVQQAYMAGVETGLEMAKTKEEPET
jgi:hypothetical protein